MGNRNTPIKPWPRPLKSWRQQEHDRQQARRRKAIEFLERELRFQELLIQIEAVTQPSGSPEMASTIRYGLADKIAFLKRARGGRRPIGNRAMSSTERSRRRRARLKAERK